MDPRGTSESKTRSCWWAPSQSTILTKFCNETSIHGLKYLVKPKRHVSERVFWLIGLLLAFLTAVYLIHQLWERYQALPVMVSFQPTEQQIDTIPFPAVTICNMNMFPRTVVNELKKIAADPNNTNYQKASQQLRYIEYLCQVQPSFAKSHHFAFKRGTNKNKNKRDNQFLNASYYSKIDRLEMIEFMKKKTRSCNQLIRLCMIGYEPIGCEDLFKPIITDEGKCKDAAYSTFYPCPCCYETRKHDENQQAAHHPFLGPDYQYDWPEPVVREWEKWKYNDGFVLPRTLEQPWRQKRSGRRYGLSLLLDPNVDDYYCPSTDSVGLKYILHNPLEVPHVNELSSVAHLGKEIFVKMQPDFTKADEDIRGIGAEKRLCYFGIEKYLALYRPYTKQNCVDECTAFYLQRECNCTMFFTPFVHEMRVCDTDVESDDFNCTDAALALLQNRLEKECGHCEPLCEDISYHHEATLAEMQNYTNLWGDQNPIHFPNGPPYWSAHKMSIMHIYFGTDTFVPKLRKRLYGGTDLIANIGGILGVFMGFSILSGLEIIYLFTLRAFCRHYNRCKTIAKTRGKQSRLSWLSKLLPTGRQNKVTQLNPQRIPMFIREELVFERKY